MINTVKSALRYGAAPLVIGAALVSAPAFAQSEPATAADVVEIDDATIIVTGSRISNPNLESSSPVAVVDAESFKTFNAPSAESLLAQNPQFLPESGPAVNNGNPGAATLNLRGLGANRTLVLVDGKRMVSYDYFGEVDINTIPSPLLKRVDVLTGGASAVYGSDAVSGVVNFILDDKFTGLQFDGSAEITEEGDGELYNMALTGGIEIGDRGNLVASVGYLKRGVVFQGDRDISKFVLSSQDLVSPGGSSTTFPTNFDNTFVNNDETYYQIGAGDNLVPYYQPYNYGPPNYLTTPQERYLATVLASFEITPGIELFGRGSYIESQVVSQSAPTGTFGYSFDIYPDNPFLTAQQRGLFFGPDATINADGSTTVGIRRRIVESGGRTTSYDNTAWQAVGGLRGMFGNFDWEVFGQYAETKRDIVYQNDITYGLVAQALDARPDGNGGVVCRDPSNGCVPINLFTRDNIGQDALSFITAQGVQNDETSQWIAGASIAGQIGGVSPWASEGIGLALGVEYRDETGSSQIDDLFASGELIGYGQGQTFPEFSYDVKEIYGEAIVPLVQDRPGFYSLNLELGARYSDYSSVGGVWTYKGGANWSPVPGLKVRGMYQRAVRAPNLYEISAPGTSGIDNLDTDPCAGSNPVGDAELTALCIGTGAPAGQIGRIGAPVSGQINAFYGGNPDLTEETSDTFTLGFIANPQGVPGLTFSVDYYNIEITDAVDVLGGSPQNVVNGCYLQFQDIDNLYCQAITRNTLTGSLSGGIEFGVDQTNFNSAVLKTAGVDVLVGYSRPIGALDFGIEFAGTYVDKYSKQGADFAPATECAGKFGFACNIAPMPKWKHTAVFKIGTEDGLGLATRWRYIGKVEQDSGTDILASKIGSYSYFDLTGTADIDDGLTFRVGVENLFDKKPPLVGAAAGGTAYNSANTFPTVYDVLGRSFFAGVTAKF